MYFTSRSVIRKLERRSFSFRPSSSLTRHSQHVSSQIRSKFQWGCRETAWKWRKHNRRPRIAASAAPRLLNFPSYRWNIFPFLSFHDRLLYICVIASTYLAQLSGLLREIIASENVFDKWIYYGTLSHLWWRCNENSRSLNRWNHQLLSFPF